MAQTFPELTMAPVDAPELSPHVAEPACKCGVDITALENGYQPGEDQALRRFAIDPEKFKALHTPPVPAVRETPLAAAGEAAQRQKPAPVSFINPLSASEPVSAADVLAQLTDTVRAHVIMQEAPALVTALWVMHTHVLEAFANTPRLVIRSWQPCSGKTTLLTLLSLLTPRPLDFCGGAGTAVLWTLGYRPTLLIDDAVSVVADSKQLQAILRSGAQRTGAKLLEVSKNGAEAVDIFIAAALAVEGKSLPPLAGRCVEIEVRPLNRGERVTPVHAGSNPAIAELQRKVARWAVDAAEQLRAFDTAEAINPMWRPLLAIAKLAGDDWRQRAHQALEGLVERQRPSYLSLLLADIRNILACHEAKEPPAGVSEYYLHNRDIIRSTDLIAALVALPGRPWREWGNKRAAITPHALADLFAEIGVAPHTLRFAVPSADDDNFSMTQRGYVIWELREAMLRHAGQMLNNAAA